MRIALVGAGMVSDTHARSLAELPETQLAQIFSRTEAAAKALADSYHVPWTTDLDSVLAGDYVEAVILTTAPYNHAPQTIAAVEAGKHVLIEKPMAISSAECDEMIAAAERNDRRLGVVIQNRFKQGVLEAKQRIDSGQLGDLLHISGYVKWHRPQSYYEANDWRGKIDREGGGVIFSQAGHTLDLMQWIGGPVQWVFTNMVTAPVHTGIEIENLGTVTMRFANGATGTLEAATALYPGLPERLELHTTRGTIRLEAGQITLWEIEGAAEADQPPDAGETSGTGAADPMAFSNVWHKRQIADFVEAIRRHRPPTVDGYQGRQLVDLCEKIYQSSQELAVVKA